MKRLVWLFLIAVTLILGLSACQSDSVLGLFQPSSTPTITPSSTPTITFTPSPTEAPTTTPSPTITPTPTPVMLVVEPGLIEVPILLYHHVTSDISNSRYNIDPEKFTEQMKWLFENGYQTITITDLAILIRQGGQIPLRAVIITFDDGNLDVFKNAYPIMREYGFVGTFYVVDSYINGSTMISTKQVQRLHENGWEIGSHSYAHSDLASAGADLGQEISFSKSDMQSKLGFPIESFAYPFGKITPDVVDKTIRYGYSSAVGLGHSIQHSMDSIYYLSRIEIENDYSMDQFTSFFPWSGPIQ